MKLRRIIALLQGLYYTVTGIWPLIHIYSFMWVTGPKEDIWLVKTVGLMITAVGLGLLAAYAVKKIDTGITTVAILSAAFLAGVDVYYTSVEVIRPIYLMDAAAEAVLIILWLVSLLIHSKRTIAKYD